MRSIIASMQDRPVVTLSDRRPASAFRSSHLDAYLDELEHRFNNRHNKFLFRDTLLKLVKAEKLPYRN